MSKLLAWGIKVNAISNQKQATRNRLSELKKTTTDEVFTIELDKLILVWDKFYDEQTQYQLSQGF